ncbi:MAG: hypothetical protein JHC81_02785 [Brevundimonas sp.]|uniref:hypothetical protein n=1 Tax=Brevundimonas sp. TaxID=1871086 RepID=UPI001A1E0EB7|nr:hypothetical protein [Brevundimonas sp.]MBJ7446435.1 hypothetical protein [Brevundimonas sp.]
MDADRAAATQFSRLSAKAFGQAHGLTPCRQTGLAAANLDDPVIVFRQDFIQARGEDVFHARQDASGQHKGAISNRAAQIRAA